MHQEPGTVYVSVADEIGYKQVGIEHAEQGVIRCQIQRNHVGCKFVGERNVRPEGHVEMVQPLVAYWYQSWRYAAARLSQKGVILRVGEIRASRHVVAREAIA